MKCGRNVVASIQLKLYQDVSLLAYEVKFECFYMCLYKLIEGNVWVCQCM